MNLYRRTAILMALTLALVANGCDVNSFLSHPQTGQLDEGVLSSSAKGMNEILVGAYAPLHGTGYRGVQWQTFMSSPDNWIYGSIMGGDAHKGSDPGDQAGILAISNGNADPVMGYFNNNWMAQYEGVTRANDVLRLVGNAEDMTDREKDIMRGEARFLRGHYYSQMARIWNKVPWIDEDTGDPIQPNDREIWADIAEDFKFAMDVLPETQKERGRPNKWAAASYLAKTYMYMHEFQDAKELFDDIIANGVTSHGLSYALNDEFQHNYNPRFEAENPEAVFQVQMVINDDRTQSTAYNAGQLNYPYGGPHTCCGFFQPTQDLVNSYRVNDDGLPYLTGYNDDPVKNDMGIQSYEPFEVDDQPVDPRLDWTVARRGTPFMDWGPHAGENWVRDQSAGGPYANQKNTYFQSDMDIAADDRWPQLVSINYNVIRFADVLLMAAEAEIEVGSLSRATDLVNRVRNRAADEAGWVSLDHNRANAAAEVNSEEEMLELSGLSQYDWVVRNDTESTWSYLGGPVDNIARWNEYKMPDYTIGEYPAFSDPDYAREAVRFERKLELAMEGHRFFDLVRWDIAEEFLNDTFFPYEQTVVGNRNGRFTPNKNEYYPIPQRQIDLSVVDGEPTLQQNPGY